MTRGISLTRNEIAIHIYLFIYLSIWALLDLATYKILWSTRFYYYTAGTGGAGPTILATSFLLLGEEVVAYNKGCCLESSNNLFILSRLHYHFVCRIKWWCWNVQLGEKIKLKPYSRMLSVDFGKGIGKRDVYLL